MTLLTKQTRVLERLRLLSGATAFRKFGHAWTGQVPLVRVSASFAA
jgi:hypothetical protein